MQAVTLIGEIVLSLLWGYVGFQVGELVGLVVKQRVMSKRNNP